MTKKEKEQAKIEEAVEAAQKETASDKGKTKADATDGEKTDKEKEYLQMIQHLQAEFENYRKRVERDRESFAKFANETILKELLPVLDNMELSFKNKGDAKGFVEAMDMNYTQLWDVLGKAGLQKIGGEGEAFNPELHEPLLQEESDKKPNTVLEILQAGYTYNDKVLQHARVKIAKGKEE